MPVEKMVMANIVGPFDMLTKTVEKVIDAGCFHPESATELMNTKDFKSINEENPYSAKLQRMKDLYTLFGAKPGAASAKGTNSDHIPGEKLERLNASLADLGISLECDCGGDITPDDYLTILENAVHSLQDKHKNSEDRLSELQKSAEQLAHFTGFDFDVERAHKTAYIHFRFGRMPVESVEKLKHYGDEISSLFVPCSEDGEYCWGLYLTPVSKIEKADRIFASLFFERLHLPREKGTPAEIYDDTLHDIEQLNGELAAESEAINGIFADNRDEFDAIYAETERLYEISEAKRYATKFKNTFMMVGWIPKSAEKSFSDTLTAIDGISVDFDESGNTRVQPPTKLKNCKVFRPFQFFVEIFGVPSYGELDPTAFLGLTYTLLYGIMFADLGQGLILALIGFFMYRFMHMALGKILIPCGISGAIFGTVFGSVFGYEHWLDPLYHSLGFEEKPFEVMNSATYLLAASIGIGVVLVIIAMCLNIASSIKRRDIGGALFGANGVVGIVMYSSIILLIAQMFISYSINNTLLAVLGIALPALLIFLKEPLSDLISGKKFKPDSIGDFILVNFFELFEVVLSYMTNTLSFLRVGAFVLIHSGMMTAFMAIADLFGGGVPTAIMMVIGNVFVIALEGLLVGIQVLRLEFYEMFSRYYDGSGKNFSPLIFRAI